MRIKYNGIIYDVLDTYSHGFIINDKYDKYDNYRGVRSKDCEIIDNCPIEYAKTKKILHQIRFSYSHTKFIDEDFYIGGIDVEENTITIYNNVVAFYSPSKHSMTIIDIKQSKRTKEGRPIWNFEKHDDNTISLSPSILSKQNEFQEHYFIKNNKVIWQGDSWEMVYTKK